MHIIEETLDDLMMEVLGTLITLPFDVVATRGESSEALGALLHLKNPLARLSRTETKGTPFSALGELIWYLAGSNDLSFIKYYIKAYEKESEDGKTIYGGYGPRLLNAQGKHNQINNIIKLLKAKPSSRKAVIQIFNAEDIAASHAEIPCTCTMQFLVRKGKLNMVTYMRSNDAFRGLPHDIFAFTMLQEIIARELSVELGEYFHSVGSLHLYSADIHLAQQYISEGVQSTQSNMPAMPSDNIRASVDSLIEAESLIRSGNTVPINNFNLEPYWIDLINLLRVYSILKSNKNIDELVAIRDSMSTDVYDTHIDKRIDSLNK